MENESENENENENATASHLCTNRQGSKEKGAPKISYLFEMTPSCSLGKFLRGPPSPGNSLTVQLLLDTFGQSLAFGCIAIFYNLLPLMFLPESNAAGNLITEHEERGKRSLDCSTPFRQ